MRPTVVTRFESRLAQSGSCWIWTGGKDSSGYGSFKVGGRRVGVHRWSFEYHVGEIPPGLQLDHICRNRACVNPAHLEPVTSRVNTLRGTGRAARQARQTHCKRGHEFTETNTRVWRRMRRCLTCRRLQGKAA